VVARAGRCVVDLTRHAVAQWLWKRLRRAFPEAIAAVLMPNHIHVLAPAKSESDARRKLGAVISALSRSRNPGAANTWEAVSSKGTFTEPQKIARHARYIVLNPTRARLAACPLEWLWSTHRDVMGAVVDPWVTPERVAVALGQAVPGFAVRHHRFVSGDTSTKIDSTPAPIRHDGDPMRYSPAQALAASIASVRGGPMAVQRSGLARRQFLAFAKRAAWPATSLECGIRPQTIREYFRAELPVTNAALMCLGAARLVVYLG
jgi:REP element-mobilizing transposase RayT